MRHRPRQDSPGILDPAALLRRVRFRRHLPAPTLQRYVEHYWLIDWDLTEPFEQNVVPHPAVNVVFQRFADDPEVAEIAGVGRQLFSIKLSGVGRVCGVQFRPGGFRPFCDRPVAELTGRRIPCAADPAHPVCVGTDDDRCRALDRLLLARSPRPDPRADEAMALVDQIRTDRTVLRVDQLADRNGLSERRLQRLFLDYVGVSPKWVIRRYRVHEAIERAAGGRAAEGAKDHRGQRAVNWSQLAADLGYSDQAHLVREFTATVGISPAAYARLIG